MSGGVDSLTCAFSAMEAGKEIATYTFVPEGSDNEDAESSRVAAKVFEWTHTEITIPSDVNLQALFKMLIKDYGCNRKTLLECTYPFYFTIPHIKEKFILTGVSADGWYGSGKEASTNYRDDKAGFDSWRLKYFDKTSPSGIDQLRQLSEEHGKILVSPYTRENKEFCDWAMTKDWRFFNVPQKGRVVSCYPEFEKVKHRKHAPAQLVAGIPEIMEVLLRKPVNFRNRTRIMDLVRDWSGINASHVQNTR